MSMRRGLRHLALIVASAFFLVPPALANETITCSWDAYGQLVQVVNAGPASKGNQTSYSYDAAGNRERMYFARESSERADAAT